MTLDLNKSRPKALLVGLQLPKVSDLEHKNSLDELARLVTTLGFEVIGTLTQRRQNPVKATVIGGGKLQIIAKNTGGTGVVPSRAYVKKRKIDSDDLDADLIADESEDLKIELENEVDDEDQPEFKERADKVVFDCELSPIQLGNLEEALGVEVLDRTGVIVEIFHRHAKTKEARLQVEIARLKYTAPRLRYARHGGDRQGSGTGAKGSGESTLELDKRRIRDRIGELTRELESLRVSQSERRSRRSDQLTVALVGYTNAGKSSLMRALTGSEVLVEDKLFATLDTTVRLLYPESKPRILVSDTVGFINKLPHDLVASFRSTLDEAGDADLLLFVVDASDPTFRAQYKVTQDVLKEIDALQSPSLLILNKIDCLDAVSLALLKKEFPEAVYLSAKNTADVKRLREKIISFFETDMIQETFFVPYEQSADIGNIRKEVRVTQESHDDQGTTLTVKGYPVKIEKLQKKFKTR